jgi:hypothetical protein
MYDKKEKTSFIFDSPVAAQDFFDDSVVWKKKGVIEKMKSQQKVG